MVERIEGFIEFIKYHDDKTGWTVLELTIQETGKKGFVTVVQEEELDYGMYIEFSGKWVDNQKFGKQFKATSFFKKKPNNLETFKKYLSKGNLFGIGPIIAEKIIDRFGEKTLDIFDNSPEKLLEIEGISEKKVNKIKEDWKKDEDLRSAKLFLKKMNIQDAMIKKIIDYYGQETEEKLLKNPYELIGVLDKYSFRLADSIAMKVGIEKDFPDRIFHGVFNVLKDALHNGNTWVFRKELINKTKNILNLKEGIFVEETINQLIENEYLSEYKNTKISLQRSFSAESGIVKNVKRLKLGTIDLPPNIRDVIEGESLANNIQLSEEQQSAVYNILQNKVSILTGGAGVGKTTTVKLILRAIYNLNHKFLLTAPTGRASQRMQEVTGFQVKTIHRLLSWSPEENGFSYNKDNKLLADFIIIDESSMIDVFLMNSLLDAIGDNTQVLFIGDPNQLPSVGPGTVLHDLIESEIINVYKLTKIFRQSEDAIIVKASYDIINKRLPQIPSLFENPDFLLKKDCFFIESDFYSKEDFKKAIELRKEGKITNKPIIENRQYNSLTFKERSGMIDLSDPRRIHSNHSIFYNKNPLEVIKLLISDIIPNKIDKNSEIQLLTPMKKGKLGSKNLNKEIQNLLNPIKREEDVIQGITKLRERDRVIQTKNNYKLDFFNGDIGYLDHIFDKKNIQVNTANKKININEIEFFGDLDLSYSITIHKSQGSEFDIVIIPVTWEHLNMLYNNLMYTAITRGKTKVFFVGNREALYYAINNKREVKRDCNLKELFIDELEKKVV